MLIKIRIIQLKRQIIALGFLYSILIIAFFCFCIYASFKVYQLPVKAAYLSVAIILVVLSIHNSRTDHTFINKHVQEPVKMIFLEYFIFSFPFTFTCLLTSQWFYFGAMNISFFIIACLKINRKTKTIFPGLSRIIPGYNFEWLSGVRKNVIAVIFCLISAYATCWFKIVPLLFLWLFTATVAGFYQECESLAILLSTASTAKNFLLQKIKQHGLLLIVVCSPVLLINSVFCPEMIWTNLVFFLLQYILLVFSVLLKYSSYLPGEDLKANSLLIAFGVLGGIIPFLTPIPLIMCFRNYGRAITRLKFYLDDQHS